MVWQPLESLNANPEFFGGATGFRIGHSLRGLIPKLPAKAAPPKDLGFFYAVDDRADCVNNAPNPAAIEKRVQVRGRSSVARCKSARILRLADIPKSRANGSQSVAWESDESGEKPTCYHTPSWGRGQFGKKLKLNTGNRWFRQHGKKQSKQKLPQVSPGSVIVLIVNNNDQSRVEHGKLSGAGNSDGGNAWLVSKCDLRGLQKLHR